MGADLPPGPLREELWRRRSKEGTSDACGHLCQEEYGAGQFIERQGWTVADGHVCVDEAVSGAVFDRPGLRRLMDFVETRPRPFDVVVMYAEDR